MHGEFTHLRNGRDFLRGRKRSRNCEFPCRTRTPFWVITQNVTCFLQENAVLRRTQRVPVICRTCRDSWTHDEIIMWHSAFLTRGLLNLVGFGGIFLFVVVFVIVDRVCVSIEVILFIALYEVYTIRSMLRCSRKA